MISKGGRTRLTLRWTTPKELLTIVLFLALALISQFFTVSFFTFAGLTEAFTFKFGILTISPLFHLLPLGVVLVLVSSWIYLMKYLAMWTQGKSPSKVSQVPRRRQRRKKTRMNFLRRIIEPFKNFFSKIGNLFLRSRGVSFVQRRLTFGRLAFESTVTVLTIFMLSLILLTVLVYPRLFTDFAVGLYGANSALHGFVLKAVEILQGILAPLEGGLRTIAPGFRNAFEGIVTSRPQSFSEADLFWRYIFCQNVAAWVSAIAALAYGKYVLNIYSSR